MKAIEIFNKVFGDRPNFMTPDPLAWGVAGDHAWELTRGSFLGEPLWGVTVVTYSKEKGGHKPNHNLSESFKTANEATSYIKSLEDADEHSN
jgi:hypothetical protein